MFSEIHFGVLLTVTEHMHGSLRTLAHFVVVVGCKSIQLCPEPFWSASLHTTTFINYDELDHSDSGNDWDAVNHRVTKKTRKTQELFPVKFVKP